MSAKRVIEFPSDRLLGYLHIKEGDGPLDFHGRFGKDGSLVEGIENSQWRLFGEARSGVEVPEGSKLLLEVLPEEARDLSPLSALRADDLAAIWLGNTFVDDDQLVHLAGLKELLWIDLQNNGNITDRGIAHISSLRSLEVFGAHWTRISAATLQHLSMMPSLTYVDVWGCDIASEALEDFKKSFPNCTVRTDNE